MTSNLTTQVVLIDDEIALRESVSQYLTLHECEVQTFASAADAINQLSPTFKGVVVSDLRMPTLDGMAVLDAVKTIDPEIPLILITGHGDIDSAVQAMQNGAYDFIEKPFQPQRLLSTITRAQEKRHLIVNNRQLRQTLGNSTDMQDCLIGQCDQLQIIREDIRRFADVNVNVLITGAVGTGKSVVAQCLHSQSQKSQSNLVRLDCSNLSDTKDLSFWLPDCESGTLVLESIDRLDSQLLTSLSSVMQENGTRVIGTTTQADFPKQTPAHHRLSTVTFCLPPLGERGDDIGLLFEHFATLASLRFGVELPDISTQDVAQLHTHAWPGNVYELEKVAEQFVLYQTRSLSQLMQPVDASQTPESLTQQVQAFEQSLIEHALAQHAGRLAEAAQALGIPRRTLSDKLQRHSIDRSRFQS